MLQFLSVFIVFVGAFLVFQIQPILSKLILPIFGGSSAVWISSLMFFQTALFLGYSYALLLCRIRCHSKQQIIHVCFVLIGMMQIQIAETSFTPDAAVLPHISIFEFLITQVGIAYVALAGTGVLVQKWIKVSSSNSADSHTIFEKTWYAWSNTGAMLALVSYPLLVEPSLSLETQLRQWGILYGALLVGLLILMYRLISRLPSKKLASFRPVKGKRQISFLWVMYPMLAVMCLMSTSYMMTQNIPSVPMIWMLPMMVYLLTYVICFANASLYPYRQLFPLLLMSCALAILMYLVGAWFEWLSQLVVYLGVLFIACYVCHGELAASSPSSEASTPIYFWCISLGGALGGILASLVAPFVFQQPIEYPLVVMLILLLVSSQKISVIRNLSLRTGIVVSFIAITGFTGTVFAVNQHLLKFEIASVRNFYGIVSVRDILNGGFTERRLIDGTTVHGSQLISDGDYRQHNDHAVGTHYYKGAGVNAAIDYIQKQNQTNIAVIGLGAGVLASFGRTVDTMTFFELNPAIIELAGSHFSYLRDAEAEINIVEGDARRSLKNEREKQAERYSLIILDAFSSDAIPIHLLTREAFELYQSRLSSNGIIAAHISNNHLELAGVLLKHCDVMALSCVEFKSDHTADSFGSHWMIISPSSAAFNSELSLEYRKIVVSDSAFRKRIDWTDQQHGIFSALKAQVGS